MNFTTIKWCTTLIYPITHDYEGDIWQPSIKNCCFPFVINKYLWAVLWNHVHIPSSSSFGCIYLCQYRFMLIYFIQWIIFCYCDFLNFWCSNYSRFSQWNPFQVHFCDILTDHCYSLSTSLFSGTDVFQAHLLLSLPQSWNQSFLFIFIYHTSSFLLGNSI